MFRQHFQARAEVAMENNSLSSIFSIYMIILIFIPLNAFADESASTFEQASILTQDTQGYYLINAGDFLSITVWNESAFSAEQLLVRPDGFISAPVVGEIKAGGQTIGQLQTRLVERLSLYLKDEPTVVATVLASGGSQIFVLGQVNAPGAYPMNGSFDVMQAIAVARGLNSFAAENKILILRRDARGVQQAIDFEYGKVRSGKNLSSNILLNSGDIIVVP